MARRSRVAEGGRRATEQLLVRQRSAAATRQRGGRASASESEGETESVRQRGGVCSGMWPDKDTRSECKELSERDGQEQ